MTVNSINFSSFKLGYNELIHDGMCAILEDDCYNIDVNMTYDTDVHNLETSHKEKYQGTMENFV